MHQNIRILRAALEEMDLPYSSIDGFFDALIVGGHSFVRASTPFNAESLGALCRDKDAVYRLLGEKILQPRTKSFLDPAGRYPEVVREKTIGAMIAAASDFLYPRIVKMNQGERGINVFIVQNDEESKAAFEMIFDKSSKNYDFIALVQEYIDPKREFRAVIASKKVALAYDRESKEIVSGKLYSDIQGICAEALTLLPLSWGSIDILESKDGKLFFLEANTRPGFDGFVSVHGEALVKEFYKSALKEFNI